MKKYFTYLVILLLLTAWSHDRVNHNVSDLYRDITAIDKEISAKREPHGGPWEYEKPENVTKWFQASDKYLLRIFKDSSEIKHEDGQLHFYYSDGTQLIFKDDHPPFEDRIPKYCFYFPVGDPNKDEDEMSDYFIIIKPVKNNDQQYYFCLLKRLFYQRGGEVYGAVRIIGKNEKGEYFIISKQEDVLPEADEISTLLKANDHNVQKMAWVPPLIFIKSEQKDKIFYFTFVYSFDVPRRAEGANEAEIDWRFDGKQLALLRIRLRPWYEYKLNGAETNLVKHEGKEFIINNE